MKTYQDLEQIKKQNSTGAIMDFVKSAIADHKTSEIYKTAVIADEYDKHRNVTIRNFRKMLYKVTGERVEDIWGANYKMACRHFNRFNTQEVQFLLGNGINWEDDKTPALLGNKKYPIDIQLQKCARKAIVGGEAFGFFNYDHVDVFGITEFVPLEDEETGALMAGIRFWQISNDKPLRATLYEIDGITSFMWYTDKSEYKPSAEWTILKNGEAYQDKKAYITTKKGDAKDKIDKTEIFDGRNYPTFPIVPLWANPAHQSELVGKREQIDCYDFIKSGFANTVDDASELYWTLENLGGMNDVDLAKFIERMKVLHAADVPEGTKLQANTIDVPYESREALLTRLERDLYRDAMALDVESIANGAVNEAQIAAAYEPLNSKCDEFEYCVIDFLNGIMEIAGIEDTPTFTRSMLANTTEQLQNIIQAAPYLSSDYVTEKVLAILGDGDRAVEMIKQMEADNVNRFETS